MPGPSPGRGMVQAGGSRGFSSDRIGIRVTTKRSFWRKDLGMARPDGSVSDRELARELGMTHVALLKARRDGRCSDSRDVDVLRRELAANTDPRMQRTKPHPKHKPPTGDLTAHRA